ncbi:MAG TPA: helix-turn-helix transcriptional regulator [Rhodanobacteraceae bacterium]
MNVPTPHASIDYSAIERIDGPALIAHVFRGKAPLAETQWHRHVRGQFMFLESGMICVRTRHGMHASTPHCLHWMPPGIEHTVRIIEPSDGWGIFVAPCAAKGLPDEPAILQGNVLMRELVHRAATWAHCENLNTEQQRLMDVLMDEMRHARLPDLPFTLPMPRDRRLLNVAQTLLAHLDDTRTRDAWAAAVGLSARSLTRRFREETGLTFEQWRQQARLSHALDQLGHGHPVAHVADALGYASVSAFVAMFKRALGQSPGRYLSLDAS